MARISIETAANRVAKPTASSAAPKNSIDTPR
jgi:hypothetical protein